MKMKKRMMRGGGSARKNGAKMMKRGGSASKNAPKMMKRGGKVKKMASGGGVSGRTISNADIVRALGDSDRTISDRDRERLREALMPTDMGDSGRTISDRDRKRLK
jgi:hypothetical protein